MSVAFSMAVLDEAVEPVPEMTEVVKGQKRRMKRNNGSRPDHLRLYATTEGSALNPQLQMRSRLVHDGYSEAEVDSALEEMWEQNLQYDDFAEVLAYLRSRNAVKDQSDSLHPFPPEEETKTASTAESTSTSTNDRQSSNGDVNGMECGETEGAIESTLFANDAERHRLTRQRKSTHPLNMFSKLDLVADYENLADAAFAVSEWVAKAADRDEIQELCAAQKTKALSTVIRRTISETHDQTKFEESVLPSILHLIGSIFLNAGMPSTAASATRKSLEAVMKQARTATQKKNDPEQVFADRVARYIVSRISSTVNELKIHGNDEGVDLILRLEDEIESMASSLATGDGGVIELISKRDANKVAAEKSSTVVGIAMATTFRGFEMPEEVEEIGVDKDEILLSLVGKVGIESMKTHSQKHQQLRERLSGIESSNVEECSRLKANLETFHAERELVAQRMEELRRAMKQLEDDDAELCMRIEETEMQISELDANCDEEASKLTRELEETEKVVDFEASVDGLADGLKVYEESLKQAVTVSNIFENCENVNEFVPSKLGVYLVHVKNYFASESECIDFLRQRVGSLEKEARDLKREIEECKALGMSATVSQMSDAWSLNRQNISDDRCVINGLIAEAQNMLTTLIGRLEHFVSDDNIQQQRYGLSSLHLTLLRGIAGTVEMMGLEDVDRLKSFLPGGGSDDLPTLVTTSHDELDALEDTDLDIGPNDEVSQGSGVEDGTLSSSVFARDESGDNDELLVHSQLTNGFISGFPSSTSIEVRNNVKPEPIPDLLVRRLTWANPGGQPKRPTVKSLLDIQKEELSSRGRGKGDGT